MINVEKDNLADIEKNALAAYAVREGLFGPPANAEAAEARCKSAGTKPAQR